MWAPAYFRTYFFPFTGTIGRSESMNSLFKKVVHPQDSVLHFVTQYEYIMDTRAERENVEGCRGEISDPLLWAIYNIEKQGRMHTPGHPGHGPGFGPNFACFRYLIYFFLHYHCYMF